MLVAQQLDRMTEAYALRPHDPVDDRAAGLTGSEAVPQILLRSDHERRLTVVMERAQAEEVCAVPPQFDAARLDQSLQADLLL
jgi:hypothetical protein